MSFFSGIASAEHTFAAWAEKEWTKVYNEAPKLAQITDTVLKYVGPALQIAVTAEAGNAAGALVGSVVSEAQTDLTAASGLVTDFGATPTAAGVISSVASNLQGLLTDAHVTSATSVSAVTKAVSSLSALSTAISTAAAAVKTS
jgi:hypothetical protein